MSSLTVFFGFFLVSLFLGDGKQPFVDVFWALGILALYALRYARLGRLSLRPLPRTVSWVWTLLLVYFAGRTLFSDSVAYSVTATVRLIEGYLLYVYFYTITSEDTMKVFVKGLIATGLIAIGASWILLLFPKLAEFLPFMNLLYANYGHNHLADLLLPIFPLVLATIHDSRNPNSFDSGNLRNLGWVVLSIYIFGMILTFARGAWVILVLYLLLQFVLRRHALDKRLMVGIACLFLVLFGALAIISVKFDSLREGKSSNALIRQIIKRPLTEDSRWGYWKQAAKAIAERPFFGSGPGTFYLQSKRLQEAPQTYSWFSHSFPLETMVEVGLVGAVLMAFVLVRSLRRSYGSPLFASACLILAYSFFEFNVSYLSIWLLFWSMMGFVMGFVREE